MVAHIIRRCVYNSSYYTHGDVLPIFLCMYFYTFVLCTTRTRPFGFCFRRKGISLQCTTPLNLTFCSTQSWRLCIDISEDFRVKKGACTYAESWSGINWDRRIGDISGPGSIALRACHIAPKQLGNQRYRNLSAIAAVHGPGPPQWDTSAALLALAQGPS